MSDIIFVMPVEGFWIKFRKGNHLPASLLAAATLLDKEGYNVKIIDQRANPNWERNLRDELKQIPLFVGITTMTGPQIIHALNISKIVKQYGIPVVWGGVHPSLMPQQTLENENIDMVVQGEGEITALELAHGLETEKPLNGVKGLWYKEGLRIKSNGVRPFLDLNELPDLPYHLVNMNDYVSNFYGHNLLSFFTSRGCPFNCGFCYNTIYNKRKWRALTAEKTLDRIESLIHKYKIEGVWFRDDNFFVDKKRAASILESLKTYDIVWGTSGARIDLLGALDNKFIDLMNESECKFLFIGVESGSDRILKLMGKGTTVSQILEVNRKMQRLNAIQRMNMMIGVPTETREDLEKTVSLSLKLLKGNKNAILSQFQIFTPYPGTDLYNLSIKHGFKPPTNLEEWSKFRFEATSIPWADIEMKDLLRMLAFTSWFVDTKLKGLAGSSLVKLLSKLYRPVAKYRFKNLDARLPIEIKFAEYVGF